MNLKFNGSMIRHHIVNCCYINSYPSVVISMYIRVYILRGARSNKSLNLCFRERQSVDEELRRMSEHLL